MSDETPKTTQSAIDIAIEIKAIGEELPKLYDLRRDLEREYSGAHLLADAADALSKNAPGAVPYNRVGRSLLLSMNKRGADLSMNIAALEGSRKALVEMLCEKLKSES